MRKSRYTDEEIANAVRQAAAGASVVDIARKIGISEATFHVWKKRIGGVATPDIRDLRAENEQLSALVDDLTRVRQACTACANAALESMRRGRSNPDTPPRVRHHADRGALSES
jgi:putative transposase